MYFAKQTEQTHKTGKKKESHIRLNPTAGPNPPHCVHPCAAASPHSSAVLIGSLVSNKLAHLSGEKRVLLLSYNAKST